MELLVLTKVDGFLGPFAAIFGWIFNILYILLDKIYELFGDGKVGIVAVTVILFTIVTKLLMTPLTIKQQKFSKMSNIMNPELTAIQEKYKGKKDEKSMRLMQMEQQAVYEKYGTTPTAGCLPMLIMFPLMFALYRIIYAIPAYVPQINELYYGIAEEIKNAPDYFNYMSEMATSLGVATKEFVEMGDNVFTNTHIIDILTKFRIADWDNLIEKFPTVANIMTDNVSNIELIKDIHSVGAFNILDTPQSYGMSLALLIPVLAIVTQLLQSKLSMTNTKKNGNNSNQDNPMVQSMNSMMYIMPFMSGFMCWMFPICVGIYWVASTVVTIIYQFFINRHIDKMDINDMIAKNVEKQNKKKEKIGIASGSQMAELAKMQTKSINAETIAESKKNSTASYANATGKNYTADKTTNSGTGEKKSISGYANMLKKD